MTTDWTLMPPPVSHRHERRPILIGHEIAGWVVRATWDDHYGCYLEDGHAPGSAPLEPTHWMDMPAPPQASPEALRVAALSKRKEANRWDEPGFPGISNRLRAEADQLDATAAEAERNSKS
jgi:hypothetical protein